MYYYKYYAFLELIFISCQISKVKRNEIKTNKTGYAIFINANTFFLITILIRFFTEYFPVCKS